MKLVARVSEFGKPAKERSRLVFPWVEPHMMNELDIMIRWCKSNMKKMDSTVRASIVVEKQDSMDNQYLIGYHKDKVGRVVQVNPDTVWDL